ncbi:Crp/Fnr family transcriptional regulator [Fulvivirga ulvae]|uniref:Crp/Fnr family transcriptional regulator n=1 Tax=Fulvivirga ulvae TaxID=2904245 RepID=UPI001F3ABABB|nr:Crp/Fnr family transcriptional regulator [Fulvivirga ulvae]UII32547.1 Crp/Fnr family transcriptional regulator [Fulvivirga ulvae]
MLNFLKSFDLLANDELNLINRYLKARTLQKGEYFIKEGRMCSEIAFVKSGILRSFYTKDNGEEITYCITFENNLTTAYSSYITGQKSPESIQALTRVELLVLKKEDVERMSENNLNWMKLLRHLAEQQYVEMERRIFSYQKEKASERYIELINEHPDYIRHIPLQYLASYLGITPRHLSRIRKELSL